MFRQKGYFNTLNGISEDFTLVQLMDYLYNMNRAISVFGSSYEKSLVLNR